MRTLSRITSRATYRSVGRWVVRLAGLTILLLAAAAFPAQSAEARADLQPRSYAYLLSRATLVVAGKVGSVSSGFMSDERKAVVEVEGLLKGKLPARAIEVSWDDKDFEETAYRNGVRVVVFLILAGNNTWKQVSPAVSCWPVEKIDLKGKRVRAVEYAYPMDLITGVPAASLKEIETTEQSMNFQVSKRKRWILTDALLPPVKTLNLPRGSEPHPAKSLFESKPFRSKVESVF